VEILQFTDFPNGGHPPFWICYIFVVDHPQIVLGGLYHCEKFGLNPFGT